MLGTIVGDVVGSRWELIQINDYNFELFSDKNSFTDDMEFTFEELGATKISLGVFENNPLAIYCYESVGFRRVARTEKENCYCLGEVWNCIEMGYHVG